VARVSCLSFIFCESGLATKCGKQDQDCIDFTDNVITTLTNFPLSPRLHTLLLARNRVSAISPSLHNSIPHLTTLVLTGNRITNLADIDPLASFNSLTHLVLLDNPVARKQHYRLWVLWRCRKVRFLDFVKVKDAERIQAIELFGEDAKHMTELAKGIAQVKSAPGAATAGVVGETDSNGASGGRVKLTEKERKRVENLIRNAKSLSEIAKLEKELNEGRVPGGVADSDDEMEE
jgi:U2 small nuclear ribonucleoprotein A'